MRKHLWVLVSVLVVFLLLMSGCGQATEPQPAEPAAEEPAAEEPAAEEPAAEEEPAAAGEEK